MTPTFVEGAECVSIVPIDRNRLLMFKLIILTLALFVKFDSAILFIADLFIADALT